MKTSRQKAGIYIAAWLALMLIYAAALYTNNAPIDDAVRASIANLLPDALLGLLVIRLPKFLRWSEEHRGRFFAAHLGLLTAFVVAALAGWIVMIGVDSVLFMHRLAFHIPWKIIPFWAIYDILIYGSLAGIAYALQNAEELREQADRAVKAEALRARASLEAMRSQLNPHFILNTFHALVGLVRREPAIAESALERLGDLLRYSLRIQRDGIDEIPLREERAFVESYLDLERLRLGDRLNVSIETPEPTRSAGMRHLNGSYAQRYNTRYEGSGHVFQGRYRAKPIVDDSHLLVCCRYVVLNPVRSGICNRPENWRWSSYRATVGIVRAPTFVCVDDVLALFTVPDEQKRSAYARFVADGIAESGPVRGPGPERGLRHAFRP